MAIKNGTSGNDKITGTGKADELHGHGGSDVIYANGGNDIITGGDGADGLYGQAGNDTIHGGEGIDKLSGGLGDDVLVGDGGNDWFHGGLGNDRMYGGLGDDTLTFQATAGSSTFNDLVVLDGGEGNDALVLDFKGDFAQDPNNTGYNMAFVRANADGTGSISLANDPTESTHIEIGDVTGIENFRLGAGDNTLFFSADATTTARGGVGNDIFRGHLGDQTFTGGGGADRFEFRVQPGDAASHDVITDFDLAQGDLLLFNAEDPSGAWDPATIQTTATEADGNTSYATVDTTTGALLHTVTLIGATGLPEPGDWYLG
jgi:Ca2+-binding RTX toxin-like protein